MLDSISYQVFILARNFGESINADEDSSIEEVPSELDKTEDLVLNTSKQKELIDNLGFVLTSYNVLLGNLENQDEFIENNNLKLYKDHLLIFMGQLLQAFLQFGKNVKVQGYPAINKVSSIKRLFKCARVYVDSWLLQ